MQASLAAAATRVKQKGAEEFVERLAAALAGKEAAAQVKIDPLLAQSGEFVYSGAGQTLFADKGAAQGVCCVPKRATLPHAP